jgi:uncharacterized protein (DUF849 family)
VLPDEIAKESFRCYKAGAAVMHILARPEHEARQFRMNILGARHGLRHSPRRVRGQRLAAGRQAGE